MGEEEVIERERLRGFRSRIRVCMQPRVGRRDVRLRGRRSQQRVSSAVVCQQLRLTSSVAIAS